MKNSHWKPGWLIEDNSKTPVLVHIAEGFTTTCVVKYKSENTDIKFQDHVRGVTKEDFDEWKKEYCHG